MSIHLKSHDKAAAAAEKAALETMAVVYRGASDDGQIYLATISLDAWILETLHERIIDSLPEYILRR